MTTTDNGPPSGFQLPDERFAAIVEGANVPSLLAALAYATGDFSLVPDELRPLPAHEANAAAQGGLTPETLAEGRGLAARALAAIRDGSLTLVSPRDDPERVPKVMEFLTGRLDRDYLPLLKFELGTPDPDWDLARQRIDTSGSEGFRVAVIGAGMSGLAAAYGLRQAGVEHVVFERHGEVGGVWVENTYPGCRLDTNNFTYSYSFAQKSDWKQEFSQQSEVRDYFAAVAESEGLRSAIRFRTEVVSARWDAEASVWDIRTVSEDGTVETSSFNAIVSGAGQLNQPSLPDIPGRDTFTGTSWHTARWNHEVDISGLRVAVIGTGASAYQVVPAISEQVAEMVVFQRSAPYMLPTPQYHSDLHDGNRWLFEHVPDYHRWFRFYVFWTAVEGKSAFSVVDDDWAHPLSVSRANEELRLELVSQMQSHYGQRTDLSALIVPTYPPYGKRMLRDNGVWAKALQLPHVHLETRAIREITPTGVRTQDGALHEVDVIIYATGFKAQDLLFPIEIIGRDGGSLREQWKDNPVANLGITVPNFPNLFLLYGPNTNLVVNGSQVLMIECSTNYILRSLRLMLERGGSAIECKADVLERFVARMDRESARRSWGSPKVQNWYKNASGRVTQNWPLSILEYWDLTRAPVEVEYSIT